MKCIAVLIGILPAVSLSIAQETAESSRQEAIGSILNSAADEQDLLLFVEELEYLQQHPVYIVTPNYNELLRLPFVSPMLAEAIVLYADTVHITSTDQLLNVSLMTHEMYLKLLPFITLEDPDSRPPAAVFSLHSIETRSRLERRLQQAQGYKDGSYRGDLNSAYQRMRAGNEHIELAGLFEKDAGETYGDGLIAGYMAAKNNSPVSQLVLGNFTISTGQGLLFAKNIAVSKGSNVIGQIQKRGNIISPSVSTDEYRFFRGVAAKVDLNDFAVAGFYSRRKLPASVDSSGLVTSFYTSGLYRTTNDLARMNVLVENARGGHVRYAIDQRKSFSFTFMNVEYGTAVSASLIDLRGNKSLSAGSISWELPFSSANFFGEIASHEGVRFSKVFGTVVPLSRRVAFSYQYRAFTQGYVGPFARPFGERADISDGEEGNYLGAEFNLGDLKIGISADMYSLPSTSEIFGISGRDLFLRGTSMLTDDVDLTMQIRNKIRSETNSTAQDDRRTQTNYRLAYKVQVTREFVLSQRCEIVNVSYQPSLYKEKGFLTFVEGIYRHRMSGPDIATRFVFFDTDSYDSRLYQYESDVAGNFSNPPLYGNGVRWYVIVGYRFFDSFALSMKYSETKKLHESVLGSGDDEIPGNLNSYVAVQLDFEM